MNSVGFLKINHCSIKSSISLLLQYENHIHIVVALKTNQLVLLVDILLYFSFLGDPCTFTSMFKGDDFYLPSLKGHEVWFA